MERGAPRLSVNGCIEEFPCSCSGYRMQEVRVASNGRAFMDEMRQLIAPAVTTSSCCIVPLLLFGLGVSGAWIGTLTRLAPYQPIFVAVTLGCLGYGYW